MDRHRLKALADAWGADTRRWPEAEQAAARSWMDANRAEADRILFDARQTDAVLDCSRPLAVSRDLRDRVLADSQRFMTAGRDRTAARRVAWLSGFGWAAAACAGLVVGHSLMGQMTANVQAEVVLYQASLTGVDDTEVLG